MWFIAETFDGIKLEFWKVPGHCELSFTTEAKSVAELDKVKTLLNAMNVKPVESPKFL